MKTLEYLSEDSMFSGMTDEDVVDTIKLSSDVNKLIFYSESYKDDVQNFFNICAFERPHILGKLKDIGCKPHISTRHSKNPIIEALFQENVCIAGELLSAGFFLFYDTKECLFKVDDERFCDNGRYIDLIDALYKQEKHNSIDFIRSNTSGEVLQFRNESEKRLYTI